MFQSLDDYQQDLGRIRDEFSNIPLKHLTRNSEKLFIKYQHINAQQFIKYYLKQIISSNSVTSRNARILWRLRIKMERTISM